MTSLRWLLTFTTTYPLLDACLWLIAGIAGALAVVFAVGFNRAIREEMREKAMYEDVDDWCGENYGAKRW